MMKICRSLTLLTAFTLVTPMGLDHSNAAPINVIHSDITAGTSSYTTPDGKLTMTPFAAGGGAGTFGPTSGCCIGVAAGVNNSGTDDGDGDPLTTADREALDIALAGDASLVDISFIFSRASGTGPTDGIELSGFTADPAASLDGGAITDGVTLNYDSGTLYVNHEWRGGNLTTVSFANTAATLGQTISIGTNDSDQAGPQAVVHNLSYEVIPEPSTCLLAGLAVALAATKRMRA